MDTDAHSDQASEADYHRPTLCFELPPPQHPIPVIRKTAHATICFVSEDERLNPAVIERPFKLMSGSDEVKRGLQGVRSLRIAVDRPEDFFTFDRPENNRDVEETDMDSLDAFYDNERLLECSFIADMNYAHCRGEARVITEATSLQQQGQKKLREVKGTVFSDRLVSQCAEDCLTWSWADMPVNLTLNILADEATNEQGETQTAEEDVDSPTLSTLPDLLKAHFIPFRESFARVPEPNDGSFNWSIDFLGSYNNARWTSRDGRPSQTNPVIFTWYERVDDHPVPPVPEQPSLEPIRDAPRLLVSAGDDAASRTLNREDLSE